jgi:hypothetical protein
MFSTHFHIQFYSTRWTVQSFIWKEFFFVAKIEEKKNHKDPYRLCVCVNIPKITAKKSYNFPLCVVVVLAVFNLNFLFNFFFERKNKQNGKSILSEDYTFQRSEKIYLIFLYFIWWFGFTFSSFTDVWIFQTK